MEADADCESYWIPLREIAPNWKRMREIKADGGNVHGYILNMVFENYEALKQHVDTFQIYNYRITFMFKPNIKFDHKVMDINNRKIYVRKNYEEICKVTILGYDITLTKEKIIQHLNIFGTVKHIEEDTFEVNGVTYKNKNLTAYFSEKKAEDLGQSLENIYLKCFYNRKSWSILPDKHDEENERPRTNLHSEEMITETNNTETNSWYHQTENDEQTQNMEKYDYDTLPETETPQERHRIFLNILERNINEIERFHIKDVHTDYLNKHKKNKIVWDFIWAQLIYKRKHPNLTDFEKYPHYTITSKFYKHVENELFRLTQQSLKKLILSTYHKIKR